MHSFDDDLYMDWADQERLVRQDVAELDAQDRMKAKRKKLAEEYRRVEQESE